MRSYMISFGEKHFLNGFSDMPPNEERGQYLVGESQMREAFLKWILRYAAERREWAIPYRRIHKFSKI